MTEPPQTKTPERSRAPATLESVVCAESSHGSYAALGESEARPATDLSSGGSRTEKLETLAAGELERGRAERCADLVAEAWTCVTVSFGWFGLALPCLAQESTLQAADAQPARRRCCRSRVSSTFVLPVSSPPLPTVVRFVLGILGSPSSPWTDLSTQIVYMTLILNY